MVFDWVRPDYANSIVNLMATLEQGLGGRPGPYPVLEQLPPARVAAARRVVLLIIDGLGFDYLQAQDDAFRDWQQGPLSSVFPSSTAPAITSFMTGAAPQQHAITGWFMYLRELGAVATILPFRSRLGGVPLHKLGLDPAAVIGSSSLFDRIAVPGDYLIGRDLVHSAYSRTNAGGAQRYGYTDLDDCFTELYRLARVRGGRRFVYGYWPVLDALSHEHGVASRVVRRHWQELADRLRELAAALQGSDTLLIVTADHGFIDTRTASVVTLDRHPGLRELLLLPLCGEPRAAFCYLREGCRQRFERYIATHLEDCFQLHAVEDLIADGWFGLGEPHPRLAERLGDYLLVGKEDRILTERLPGESEWSLIGVHGGPSRAEMRVPLLVSEC